MNKKKQVLINTFTQGFDMTRFVEFTTEFFNGVQMVAPNRLITDFWNWSEFSYFIEGYSHVANYTDPNKTKLSIFVVKLKKGRNVEKARSMQRNFVSKLLTNGNLNGAIVAFFAEDDTKWRLSFVKLEMEFIKGKVETRITPAKRYSYLVGHKEPCHTAMNRLLPIFENEDFNPTLSQIEEAFSVEVVTKEFFEKYKQKYFELKEYLEGIDSFISESQRHNFTSEQFAKKLMGQIAFLYFLQKKGWLGVKAIPDMLNEKEYKNAFFSNSTTREIVPRVYTKVAEDSYKRQIKELDSLTEKEEFALACGVSKRAEAWGTGSKTYLRDLFEWASLKGNFFDTVLEPLFYEALNKKREANDYYCKLHCRIPFLNGGLFEPLDNYDWNNNDFSIPNEMFSNKKAKGEDADGILDIFDRYNFTINEDEPLEREVAVDPEMLGKIFENLLDVKDRKSKGAFYTPREIVHYMCQESLINYLVNEVSVPYEDIKEFILYGEILKDEDTSREVKDGIATRQLPETVYAKLYDIDKALASVKVADPAVGSGAFPMGMVSEICKARNNITAYLALQAKNSYEAGLLFRETRAPYHIKKETLRNSIFAVDIEPSAVDITKLRLWLSLVVEQDIDDGDNKNPHPLPNLDCNIMCGNSLIDEFEGIKLFDDKILTGEASDNIMDIVVRDEQEAVFNRMFDAQKELFYANDHSKKEELKAKIEQYIDLLIEKQLHSASPDTIESYKIAKKQASTPYFLWKLRFAKVFKEKGGFDIVIGNPPYVGFHNVPNKDYFKKKFYVANGKYDFYILFIERAIALLKKHGFASYICPSYFYKREYGKDTRDFLLTNTTLKYIADFKDFQIFDSALTYTCIFCAEKNVSAIDDKLKILGTDLSDNEAYFIDLKNLKEPSWDLEKKATNLIMEKVLQKSTVTFGEITSSIPQGIVTGNNDIYLLSKNTIDELGLEMKYLKPAYKGKDISGGKLVFSERYIFYPYILTSGKDECVSEEILQNECPNLYAYLLENKEILLSRDYFAKSNKKWYELWNPRKMQHFYNRKFVFSEIGFYNDFVLVDECFYTDSACGAELLKNYAQYEKYIQLYLNSTVATYIYKKLSVPKASGYSIYKNSFLKGMPIVYNQEIESTNAMFIEMKQEDFNVFLNNYINLTPEEIAIVEGR